MKKKGELFRNIIIALIIALFPAIVLLWHLTRQSLITVKNVTEDRIFSTMMNQAERFTLDLDLELSLLDSLIAKSKQIDNLKKQIQFEQINKIINIYLEKMRWPELVDSIILVIPSETENEFSTEFLLPSKYYDHKTLRKAISKKYNNFFYQNHKAIKESTKKEDILLRSTLLYLDQGEDIKPGLLVTIINQEVLINSVIPTLSNKYFGTESNSEDLVLTIIDSRNLYRFCSSDNIPKNNDLEKILINDTNAFDLTQFYTDFTQEERNKIFGNNNARFNKELIPPPPKSQQNPNNYDVFQIDNFRLKNDHNSKNWKIRIAIKSGPISKLAEQNRVFFTVGTAILLLLMYTLIIVLFIAIRKNKLSAQKEKKFIASITHELKTPVAITLSAGENLEKGIVPQEKIQFYGNIVATEARRLGDSIEKVLLLAGLETNQDLIQNEAIDVSELVKSIINKLKPSAEKKSAYFVLETNEELPPIADGISVLIESALQSIFSNAIKYASGKIVIKIYEQKNFMHKNFVHIKCIDNGPGIEREDRPHVLEPFFRTKRVMESGIPGTGIGLYLARQIAKVHGGDIKLYYPNEGGLIVEIILRSYV